MKDLIFAIHYEDSGDNMDDLVIFTVPEHVRGVDIEDEIDILKCSTSIEMDEHERSRLEWAESIFDRVARKFGGKWKYLPCENVIFIP